jgi:hypothetical protein
MDSIAQIKRAMGNMAIYCVTLNVLSKLLRKTSAADGRNLPAFL